MHAPLARTPASVAVFTLLILLVPAVAMQFSGEVNWGPGDFVAAGALLFGAGTAYGIASRRASSATQRALIGTAVLLVLCLAWAELAVGLFD